MAKENQKNDDQQNEFTILDDTLGLKTGKTKPFVDEDLFAAVNNVRQTEPQVMKLICMGKTGTGKSALGNTILGEQFFNSSLSFTAVTERCKVGRRVRNGTQLVVVDTPGLFDSDHPVTQVQKEITCCMEAVLPGPHAFLIVIRSDVRFSREEQDSIAWIRERFGERALSYCIVIFSHRDVLERHNQTIEQRVQACQYLQEFTRACGDRFLAVDNMADIATQETYVVSLMNIVSMLMQTNGGRVFTNDMIDQLARMVQRRSKETLGEFKFIEPNGYINVPVEAESIVREYFIKTKIQAMRNSE